MVVNAILMTNAQFYFAVGVPLVSILVNVVLFSTLSHRVDRLEDRMHTGHDLLIGKIGEVGMRLVRLEARSSR